MTLVILEYWIKVYVRFLGKRLPLVDYCHPVFLLVKKFPIGYPLKALSNVVVEAASTVPSLRVMKL